MLLNSKTIYNYCVRQKKKLEIRAIENIELESHDVRANQVLNLMQNDSEFSELIPL